MRISTVVTAAGAAVFALVAAAVPAAAAEVPGCERGCEEAFAIALPDGARFVGLRTEAGDAGLRRAMLAYYVGDRLRAVAEPVEDAGIGNAVCGTDGDAQRCAVEFAEGAHSSSVAAFRLTPQGGIEMTDKVTAGTPASTAADIDGNGRPDAVLLQSTYEPDYASAPRFWQTLVERDGRFVLTGCSPLEQDPLVQPRAPLNGPCPG